MTRNLDRIQKGTMMMGAGLALMAAPAALVASTAATQKALGEMASPGTKDLRTLEDTVEAFSNHWAGASKAEFIGACYDVKSALANLSDEAVGTFGAMAAITVKQLWVNRIAHYTDPLDKTTLAALRSAVTLKNRNAVKATLATGTSSANRIVWQAVTAGATGNPIVTRVSGHSFSKLPFSGTLKVFARL